LRSKKKVKLDMFKNLKYPANDGNFCRVDKIDVIVKEEFEKLSVDDPIDQLITYSADKEFERFSNKWSWKSQNLKGRGKKQKNQQKIHKIADRRKYLRTAKSAQTEAGNSRAKIVVRSPKFAVRNFAQLSYFQLLKVQTRPKTLQAHPRSSYNLYHPL
jgi:hypothetical protein